VKRFYELATAARRDDGFTILLDARAMLTPAKNPIALPTAELAEAIAAEWSAQTEEIDTTTMPYTRHAYTAIDGVQQSSSQVVQEVARFAETDLTCYWAEGPDSLTVEQAAAWQPLLDWLQEQYGVSLAVTRGIMPVQQQPESLAALTAVVAAHDPFALTALHTIVSISGSLVIGLAVSAGHLASSRAWQVSRIDHDYQAAQWGEDPEAAADAARTKAEFEAAARFLDLVRSP